MAHKRESLLVFIFLLHVPLSSAFRGRWVSALNPHTSETSVWAIPSPNPDYPTIQILKSRINIKCFSNTYNSVIPGPIIAIDLFVWPEKKPLSGIWFP